MSVYQSQVTQLLDSINGNIQRIQALGASEALEIGNAKADVQAAKQNILRDIDNLFDLNNRVKMDTDTFTQQTKQVSVTAKEARTNVKQLEKEIQKNQNLMEVRTAQAAALKEKYASNYHSSWLGLWRPLSSEGQSALIFASIIFGLIALISLFFIGKQFIPASVSQASFMLGGKRLFSRRS